LNTSSKELNELERRFKHSEKHCTEQINNLRNFIGDVSVILGNITDNSDLEKAKQSLGFFRFLQAMLDLNELPFLLMVAHYTSGIQILRYHLECSIQAFYLDQQHPTFSLQNKICVLTEVSDNREYFVARLIDRISVGQKEHLKKLYKELSLACHPSHLDFPKINEMMNTIRKMEARIDCEEMAKVVDLTKRTYDAIFFLTLESNSKAKEAAKKQSEIKKVAQKHGLLLLDRMI